MNAAVSTSATTRTPAHRRRSLVAGWLYLLTFVSIPSLVLYNPVKSPNYILGSGTDRAH